MKKNYKKEYSLYKNGNKININVKDLLKENAKLIIYNNDREIYRLENIQTLYLYPLTIMDYVDNLKENKIICLNIINIESNLDYEGILNKKEFKYLKNVEILIKDTYKDKEIKKIIEIISILKDKNNDISLNIKDLTNIPSELIDYYKYVSYFKIFLQSNLTQKDYEKFLSNLKIIKEHISTKSLIHVKAYLNKKDILLYEKYIKDFTESGVDIFQISKELIPINHKNIDIETKMQDIIRNLEKKYYSFNTTKFITVKDITTLYYPRFELDERNSKKCYACKMKPYLLNNKIIPCKVKKIFDDINNWSTKVDSLEEYNNITSKCGITCDDCASIFENDLLYDVETILNNQSYDYIKIYIEGK